MKWLLTIISIALVACNSGGSSDDAPPPAAATPPPADGTETPTTPTPTTPTPTTPTTTTGNWIQADCLVNGQVETHRVNDTDTNPAPFKTSTPGPHNCHIRFHTSLTTTPTCTLSGGNITGLKSVGADSGNDPHYVLLSTNLTWTFSCNSAFNVSIATNVQ